MTTPSCHSSSWCQWILAGLLSVAGSAMGAEKQPLKVYLLVGQSNMQGHAHVRTLEHLGMDPKTEPLLQEIQGGDGKPHVSENVWVSYLSSAGERSGQLTTGFGADESKIGPELMFGIRMQRQLGESILIIKAAWGGKSLHTDFRPPSAGPYVFNGTQLEGLKKQGKDVEAIKAERAKATGHYYRLTIAHAKKVLADIKNVVPSYDEKEGYELAGFVWFQGWNDMVDRGVYPTRDQAGGYDNYSKALVHFIRDVRTDLAAPNLPFVIGVMGAGGPVADYLPDQQRYAAVHQNFRDAMAAPASLPEFNGNVTAVLTERYWDQELTVLRARDGEINQQLKRLDREERNAAQNKLRAEAFTPRELETLEKGVSNAEYHYLGSAKIMARIGEGFAEALKPEG